jgi:hypothetical protein
VAAVAPVYRTPQYLVTVKPVVAQPVPSTPATLDLRSLFLYTPVITVLGRVQDWAMTWPGNITCTLLLSIGAVRIATNRDYLPTEIQDGSWVVAKLMLARGSSCSSTCLFSAVEIRLQKGDPTTSWWPTADCERQAHMRRLRQLLSRLEPGLQAIFMAVMANAKVQHKFVKCMAALDHHSYPGGLFDQSVEAAELVYSRKYLGRRERGIAAMACLLYDIGKISDAQILLDRPRLGLGMQPHAQTAGHLRHPLNQVSCTDPDLVASLRSLLARCRWIEWLSPPGLPLNLKQHAHLALQKSWKLAKPGHHDSSNSGASA